MVKAQPGQAGDQPAKIAAVRYQTTGIMCLISILKQLLKPRLQNKIRYQEVNKFPVMQRDLAMVVNVLPPMNRSNKLVKKLKLPSLKDMRLFDVFESDKLGADKKSMAISFFF
jgi:phenylalanyl-tRNA synthetase beta chain